MASKKEASKKESKKATAAEVDDVLGEGKPTAKKASKKAAAEDPLEGKKASKKAAAPAKKAKAKKEATGVSTEDVRNAILKCRKLTSYADVAESTGAEVRQVRRTARAMRDEGLIAIEKEGTVCYVKKA